MSDIQSSSLLFPGTGFLYGVDQGTREQRISGCRQAQSDHSNALHDSGVAISDGGTTSLDCTHCDDGPAIKEETVKSVSASGIALLLALLTLWPIQLHRNGEIRYWLLKESRIAYLQQALYGRSQGVFD